MNNYKVRFCEYDQKSTKYGDWFDWEEVIAEDELEAINLLKNWIFENSDRINEYPNMKITEDGIDLGNGIEYRCFEAKIYNLKWCIIHDNGNNEMIYVCDSKEEAIKEAEERWNHMIKTDKHKCKTFAVALLNIQNESYAEINGIIDSDWYEVGIIKV